MRDPNLDAQSFVRSLEKFFTGKSKIAQHLQVLRNHVLVSSNLGQEVKLSGLKKWKFDDIVVLAISTHFDSEKWFAEMLREEIKKVSKRLPDYYQIVLEILLDETKGEALCYLIETNLWHTREFFGNVMKSGTNAITSLRTYIQNPRKPKPTQRKRGYTDQGSRAPEDVRIRRVALEEYYQELSTKISTQIEVQHDSYNLLKGSLG